jgi:hypothetical protein
MGKMQNTEMDQTVIYPSLLKWIGIMALGGFLFPYIAGLVPILTRFTENLANSLLSLVILPIFFYSMVLYNFLSNVELLIWLSWEVPWILVLFTIYKRELRWSQDFQLKVHILAIIIGILPFLLLILLTSPTNPGIPAIGEPQVLDPFYTVQVTWIIPLWFMAWMYSWVLRIPQELKQTRSLNLNQVIWLGFFVLINVYIIFFLGEYIYWMPSFEI